MLVERNMATALPQSERPLRPDEIHAYWRDGFVAVPGLFSAEEVAPLQAACRADPSIDGALVGLADSTGAVQQVVSWTELGDTLVGVFPRLARIVAGAAALIGAPVYHWHSKLSLKPPRSEGRWDWHQDYGYWYFDGCLWPDLTTCMIAVDAATAENGCVQLVKGSHRLGRVEHARVGQASGVEPERLAEIQARLETVPCVMQPGDAVFFHCNTLHASGPNRTDAPRTLLHCSYNAVHNSTSQPGQEHHAYKPLAVLPDTALREGRYGAAFDQEFLAPPPGKERNSYGYTVLRHPSRAGRPRL
jgi:hypothetical protein